MSAAWVYRCYDAGGRLIYVGSTQDLGQRMRDHNARAWWAGQVTSVQARPYPSRPEALAAEREAIRTENPRWNTSGKWAHRSEWSLQDALDYVTAIRRRHTPMTLERARHLARAESFLAELQAVAA